MRDPLARAFAHIPDLTQPIEDDVLTELRLDNAREALAQGIALGQAALFQILHGGDGPLPSAANEARKKISTGQDLPDRPLARRGAAGDFFHLHASDGVIVEIVTDGHGFRHRITLCRHCGQRMSKPLPREQQLK